MENAYHSEDLIINTELQKVTQNKKELKLPQLSYDTLMVLINNAPTIVTFDQLIDQAWQDIEVSQETVTQRIALLRKSLSKNNQNKTQYIASVRSKGYRWVPKVTAKPIHQEGLKLKHKVKWGALSLITLALFLSMILSQKKEVETVKNVAIVKDDYLTQAKFYLSQHDLKSNQLALGLYRKVLERQPKNTEALIGASLALSHQVTKFNQDGVLLNEAEAFAKAAKTFHPEFSKSWLALGFVHDAKGEINQAISAYEKALDFNREDYSAMSSLAYLYMQKGQLADSLKLNLEIYGKDQQRYLNLQIANSLDLLDFDLVAEHWYQRADELSPDNVFTTAQRAKYYLSYNQKEKAQIIIEEALQRGVERPELYIILGLINWLETGELKSGSVNFSKAKSINDRHFEANLWSFLSTEPNKSQQNEFEKEWFFNENAWSNIGLFKAIFYSYFDRGEEAILSLNESFEFGFTDYKWINTISSFDSIRDETGYIKVVSSMQDHIKQEKQKVMSSEWLPISFLDPQKYFKESF